MLQTFNASLENRAENLQKNYETYLLEDDVLDRGHPSVVSGRGPGQNQRRGRKGKSRRVMGSLTRRANRAGTENAMKNMNQNSNSISVVLKVSFLLIQTISYRVTMRPINVSLYSKSAPKIFYCRHRQSFDFLGLKIMKPTEEMNWW